MADLKIPSLNKKTDKYIFKNKFNSRRKSKRQLLIESLFMVIFSFLLIFINYLIPNKASLFKNFLTTFEKSIFLFIDIFSYLFQLLLVIFIVLSFITSMILLLGAFYRIFKVLNGNTRNF